MDYEETDSSDYKEIPDSEKFKNITKINVLKIAEQEIEECDCGTQLRFVNICISLELLSSGN